MSNARETIALRAHLLTYLRHDEIRDINWHTVTTTADPAITRGWTGRELADWCASELGPGADNPGALIVTTLRALADIDPPRDTTPQPTHINDIRAAQAAAIQAARNVDHKAWAQRIRQLRHQPP